jgi:hypothetical protein
MSARKNTDKRLDETPDEQGQNATQRGRPQKRRVADYINGRRELPSTPLTRTKALLLAAIRVWELKRHLPE